MERWWNLEVSLVVPFDTREEAEAALFDLDWDRFLDVAHELFGGCREVMSAGIVEASEED
jgi:hypothetical protein